MPAAIFSNMVSCYCVGVWVGVVAIICSIELLSVKSIVVCNLLLQMDVKSATGMEHVVDISSLTRCGVTVLSVLCRWHCVNLSHCCSYHYVLVVCDSVKYLWAHCKCISLIKITFETYNHRYCYLRCFHFTCRFRLPSHTKTKISCGQVSLT